MTDTDLAGRDLDARVAEAMGWKRWTCQPRPRAFWRPPEWQPADEYTAAGVHLVSLAPADALDFLDGKRDIPAYSAPDCSGLAPVLDWLTANAPTPEQAGPIHRDDDPILGVPAIECGWSQGKWWAAYVSPIEDGSPVCIVTSGLCATLPEAACRLAVAWDRARRERGWAP